MLKNAASFVAAALVVFGAASSTIAQNDVDDTDANSFVERAAELSPNAQVCTGGVGVGCITIPISSSTCINFTGGLSFLNKEVSSAVIPPGFACTFYEKSGCLSDQGGADQVILQGGTWDFFKVPGTAAATVNFNDKPSSFICTPV